MTPGMGRWTAVMCRVFFHKLVVVREFGISRKVRCLRCGRAFGMHDGVKAFIPWDGELEQAHRTMGHLEEEES